MEQPDFIQRSVDAASGVQLQTCITLCKQFLQIARTHNEFLEASATINVVARLRDCAIAECLRREINFIL